MKQIGKTAQGGKAYAGGVSTFPLRVFDSKKSFTENLDTPPARWQALVEVGQDFKVLFEGTQAQAEAFASAYGECPGCGATNCSCAVPV